MMPIPSAYRPLLKPVVGGAPRVLMCDDGAMDPSGETLDFAEYRARYAGRPHRVVQIHGLTLAEAVRE